MSVVRIPKWYPERHPDMGDSNVYDCAALQQEEAPGVGLVV